MLFMFIRNKSSTNLQPEHLLVLARGHSVLLDNMTTKFHKRLAADMTNEATIWRFGDTSVIRMICTLIIHGFMNL